MISEEKRIEFLKAIKEIYDRTKNSSEEITKVYNEAVENPIGSSEAIVTKVGRLTGVVSMLCKRSPEEFSKVMYVLQMLYQTGIIMIKD